MMSFEDLFLDSGGRSIEYKGMTVAMFDLFPLPPSGRLEVVFESVDSEWRQGVLPRADGIFEVAGAKIEGALVLWQDTAPKVVDIGVESRESVIEVRNVWDVGDGVMHSWHNGGALVVEPGPTGRRYLCNDGHPNDDFTDLVFRLTGS